MKNLKCFIFLIGCWFFLSSCAVLQNHRSHHEETAHSLNKKGACPICQKKKNKSCSACQKKKSEHSCCQKHHKDKGCSACKKKYQCKKHGDHKNNSKTCSVCQKKKKGSCSACQKHHKDKGCSACKKKHQCKKHGDHKGSFKPCACKNKTGSVIFFHPDGMSLAHWDAIRLFEKGFNGFLNFDFLPYMAVYRGTIRDQVSATSNAGATIHAFGVKTGKDSFGMDQNKNILSARGEPHSILISAKKKGLSTALVQSGALIEPGTAVFTAQVHSRKNKDEIAKQIIESDLDLVFSGGEQYLLPAGAKGHFGSGARKDGLNLIEQAKQQGYTVIYSLKNFRKQTQNAEKILGVFALNDTYNSKTQEELDKEKLDHYQKNAPTIAEMTKKALHFLEKKNKPFFAVIEEEGTDNFSNRHNTAGFLKSAKRADEALGAARDFLKDNPNTLLLTASDSNAGGPVISNPSEKTGSNVLRSSFNKQFKSSKHPFFNDFKRKNIWKSSKNPYLFSIVWASPEDLYSGVVVKAEGLNGSKVRGVIENTQIYDLIYLTLFGAKI